MRSQIVVNETALSRCAGAVVATTASGAGAAAGDYSLVVGEILAGPKNSTGRGWL